MAEKSLNEKIETFFAAADGDEAALSELNITKKPIDSADDILVNQCLRREESWLRGEELAAFAAQVAADERIQKHLPAIAMDTVGYRGIPNTRLDRGIDKLDDGISKFELTDAMTRKNILQWNPQYEPIDISPNVVRKLSMQHLKDNFDTYRAQDQQDRVVSTSFFGGQTRANHSNITVSDLQTAHRKLIRSYNTGVKFSLE